MRCGYTGVIVIFLPAFLPGRRQLALRAIALFVAVTLAVPAAAAPTEQWLELRQEGMTAYERGDNLRAIGSTEAARDAYTEAARRFTAAADAVPAGAGHDGAQVARGLALRAHVQVQELTERVTPCPSEAMTRLREAIAAADAAQADESTLGETRSLRERFSADLAACEAANLTAVVVVQPQPEVEPEAVPPVAPRRDRYSVGLWTATAAAGALGAVALGTGLAVLHEPFKGAAYKKVLDAAEGSFTDSDPSNDVAHGANDDMCDLARGPGSDGGVVNVGVVDACDRWTALRRTSIVTGIGAGVAVVVAATFLGLKLRRHRGGKQEARRLRFDGSVGATVAFTISGSF